MRWSFPSAVLEPGSYEARFWIDGRALPGSVELAPLRRPVAQFYDDEGLPHQSEFPKQQRTDRLVGQLRTNHDIVFYNANVTEFFPGRYSAVAPYALVGLGLLQAEDALRQIELQIEGLDEFLWSPPVKELSWPEHGEGRFAAKINKPTEITWTSTGVEIKCMYIWQVEHDQGYRFNVSFAPLVNLISEHPFNPDEWIVRWIIPFARLMSFGMRKPRRTSWVVLSERDVTQNSPVRAQLFGGGITQQPYKAARPTIRQEDDHPLFTAQDLPSPLPDLLTRWRNLDSSDNPFPELYRLASVPDLPERARFLYLVQALEGLHGFEHRGSDSRRQSRYESKRTVILDEIEEEIGPEQSRRLGKIVPRRAPDSLDRRILSICKNTPQAVIARLSHETDDPIALRYAADGDLRFEQIVRRLRNDLSHGNFNPLSGELLGWAGRLDRLCQAQLLRLLSFGPDLIDSRLG